MAVLQFFRRALAQQLRAELTTTYKVLAPVTTVTPPERVLRVAVIPPSGYTDG